MSTKASIVLLILLFLLCNSVPAQVSEKSSHIDSALLEENLQAEAEIEKLVHELYESIRNKDLEKQKSFHYYSDKFSAFYGGQKRKDAEGAQEYEKNLLNNLPADVEFNFEDMQVNVYDKVAVASFHIYVTSSINGEKRQSQAQITLVYLNLNGKWLITHEHVSPLKVD